MKPAQIGAAALILLVGAGVAYWAWGLGMGAGAPTPSAQTPPATVSSAPASKAPAPSPAPAAPSARVELPVSPPAAPQDAPASPPRAVLRSPVPDIAYTTLPNPPVVEVDASGVAVNKLGEIEFSDGVPMKIKLATGEDCIMTARASTASDGSRHVMVEMIVTAPGSDDILSMPRVSTTPSAEVRITVGGNDGGLGLQLTPKIKGD